MFCDFIFPPLWTDFSATQQNVKKKSLMGKKSTQTDTLIWASRIRRRLLKLATTLLTFRRRVSISELLQLSQQIKASSYCNPLAYVSNLKFLQEGSFLITTL